MSFKPPRGPNPNIALSQRRWALANALDTLDTLPHAVCAQTRRGSARDRAARADAPGGQPDIAAIDGASRQT